MRARGDRVHTRRRAELPPPCAVGFGDWRHPLRDLADGRVAFRRQVKRMDDMVDGSKPGALVHRVA